MAHRESSARSTGRRSGLTADDIVEAALELSDGAGLDAWSQRDLARHLDVTTTVIYHHIGGRDQVLRAVVQRVIAQFPVPDATLEWDEWFRALLYPARPILLRYPGVAKWLLMHGPAFPDAVRTIRDGIAALRRGGFTDAPHVYTAIVNTAVLTVSMRDDRLRTADDGPRDHRAMLTEFSALPGDAEGGTDEIIGELIAPLADDTENAILRAHEAHFRLVLEAMIAGMRTRLA